MDASGRIAPWEESMRFMIAALAATAMTAGLAATPVFAQSNGYVGIAMPTQSSARWISDGNSMVEQFEAAGYTTDLQYAEDDIPNQLAQIENMITKGVNVLVIAAIDGTTLSNALANANASGIKVIAYDRLIRDSEHVDYYATFDNFQVGVQQGQSLLDGLDIALTHPDAQPDTLADRHLAGACALARGLLKNAGNPLLELATQGLRVVIGNGDLCIHADSFAVRHSNPTGQRHGERVSCRLSGTGQEIAMSDYSEDTGFEQDDEKSKSQVKRELHALQDLGKRLTELKPAQLEHLPLTDKLQAALDEAVRADKGRVVEDGGRLIFVQVYAAPLRLVVVGAVHIAQALVPMAQIAGYDVTVVDPRRAFASDERFPAVTVVSDWPDDALQALGLDARTAVVTLTHDPKLDDPALDVALRSEAFYIAALGSRRTHATRRERLAALGHGEDAFARIHGPAGLSIGAVSPAETVPSSTISAPASTARA